MIINLQVVVFLLNWISNPQRGEEDLEILNP